VKSLTFAQTSVSRAVRKSSIKLNICVIRFNVFAGSFAHTPLHLTTVTITVQVQ
jgi:hypothetical protein